MLVSGTALGETSIAYRLGQFTPGIVLLVVSLVLWAGVVRRRREARAAEAAEARRGATAGSATLDDASPSTIAPQSQTSIRPAAQGRQVAAIVCLAFGALLTFNAVQDAPGAESVRVIAIGNEVAGYARSTPSAAEAAELERLHTGLTGQGIRNAEVAIFSRDGEPVFAVITGEADIGAPHQTARNALVYPGEAIGLADVRSRIQPREAGPLGGAVYCMRLDRGSMCSWADRWTLGMVVTSDPVDVAAGLLLDVRADIERER